MEISPQIVRDDEAFRDFIEKRELKESTELLYAQRLTDFCNFMGKCPVELVDQSGEWHNKEHSSSIISNYLEEYFNKLVDDGKSSNTIKNRYDTLNAFFSNFDIELSNIKNKITNLETENLIFEEMLGLEHVKKAVNMAGLRDKAIILLHFTSGIGAVELRNLTYGDFIDSVDEYLDLSNEERLDVSKVVSRLDKRKDIIGTWHIKKVKTGINYTTFNTPESTQAILDYLIDRKMKNKLIKSFNGPLFVNTWNKPLAKSVHGAIFKRINDKAGFGHVEGKRRFFTSQTLRNSFENSLYNGGLNKTIVDCLLGHKIEHMGTLKYIEDIEALKIQYISALDYLSIDNYYEGKNHEFKFLMAKFNEKEEELNQIKMKMRYLEEKMKSMSYLNERKI